MQARCSSSIINPFHPAGILLGLRPCGQVSSLLGHMWLYCQSPWPGPDGSLGWSSEPLATLQKKKPTWNTALTVQRWQTWQEPRVMKEHQNKSEISSPHPHSRDLLLISRSWRCRRRQHLHRGAVHSSLAHPQWLTRPTNRLQEGAGDKTRKDRGLIKCSWNNEPPPHVIPGPDAVAHDDSGWCCCKPTEIINLLPGSATGQRRRTPPFTFSALSEATQNGGGTQDNCG